MTALQRRTLLKAAGLAATTSLGAPALIGKAQSPITLKFHTFMAPTSNVWLTQHKVWMDKVEKDSGGRIRFEGYPAMQLGGTPAQLFDQVRDGVVDIVWTLPGNTPGRFPRAEAFELPFLMSDAEATSKAFWAFCQTAAPDEFKDVHPLALHVHGPGLFHMKEGPIKTAADLKGKKVRGPTRQITKMLQKLGATAVGMPLPQIPDALSKGVIDGCVLPWEVVASVKVHELAKYHSEFAPEAGALYTTTFIMAMNKARYHALPAELRAVIDRNSGLETSAFMGRTQQGNDPVGRKAASDRGNPIHSIARTEAEVFRRLVEPIYQDWIDEMNKRGFNGKQLIDTARGLIQKYTRRN